MNQRTVDLALLIGIGVLLVAILVLALSAAPMRGGSADNPPGAETQGDAATQLGAPSEASPDEQPGEDVAAQPDTQSDTQSQQDVTAVDVTPEDAASGDEEGTPEAAQADVQAVDPSAADTLNEQTSGADIQPNTDAETQVGEGAEDVQADAAPTEEASAPAGEVNLNRVGFAFITAETGACSIPLEPWRQVAVSRDLLAQYGCGAAITLNLADTVNGAQQVTAQIADTMNPSFERTVNIFVGEEEPALEYGITTGTLQGTSP